MGGSSGSEPRASPMISASENMSSAVASGDIIPRGSPAPAVIVAGCHSESCGPSSGVISSGGTTTRGYSSLNGSSNIGGPWRYQGSSGSLSSCVIGMSVSSWMLSSWMLSSWVLSSCLRTPANRNQRPAPQASTRTPETMSTTAPAGSVPSSMRARASAHSDGRASSGVPSRNTTAAGPPTTTRMASAYHRAAAGERLNVGHRADVSPTGVLAPGRAREGVWTRAAILQGELSLQRSVYVFF